MLFGCGDRFTRQRASRASPRRVECHTSESLKARHNVMAQGSRVHGRCSFSWALTCCARYRSFPTWEFVCELPADASCERALLERQAPLESNLSGVRAFLRDVAWEPISALLATPRDRRLRRLGVIDKSGKDGVLQPLYWHEWGIWGTTPACAQAGDHSGQRFVGRRTQPDSVNRRDARLYGKIACRHAHLGAIGATGGDIYNQQHQCRVACTLFMKFLFL